ncbi:pilus protein PilZ [Geomonas silvestris]|uniref:Pilus protein PilZ n=1 Tax=Geomonas silvestris TaxID=2740184 RepID=A0A6V8ML67_9BACT|nr:PilZ domain-containing protein [Geomonas silvestris]GFO60738.1 pilus protein PilZ [Geomonas silvestris]
MKKEHYKLITIADGKSDADAIREVLAALLENRLKNDLVLVNYYDEVPVSYRSAVTGLESDGVEMSVHEHQALIMKHEKSTLIKSSHFQQGFGVHCYASYVNVPKKLVILNNFSYAQIRAERREAIRVKVRDTLPVQFSSEGGALTGNLVDISGIGLSLTCEAKPRLRPGQSGEFSFNLGGTAVQAPGCFVRADLGESGSLCMFKIRPDRRNDSFISQFIYQRQVEIVRELKDMVEVA